VKFAASRASVIARSRWSTWARMSSTMAVIAARRSGEASPSTKILTGPSNFRIFSTRASSCSSALNAILKKPSLISSSLKVSRSVARRPLISGFSASAIWLPQANIMVTRRGNPSRAFRAPLRCASDTRNGSVGVRDILSIYFVRVMRPLAERLSLGMFKQDAYRDGDATMGGGHPAPVAVVATTAFDFWVERRGSL